MFANKVYTIKDPSDPKSIILRNMGNIPSNFEWIDCNNSEIIQTVLVPQKGVIEPKSDIHIKFKFVVKLFGKFSFYFKCNVDALDIPIGFELKADVYGLDISYELPPGPSREELAKKVFIKRRSSAFAPVSLSPEAQKEPVNNDTQSSLKTHQSKQKKPNIQMSQLEFLD